jgi:AcrR family transcriptional regulator
MLKASVRRGEADDRGGVPPHTSAPLSTGSAQEAFPQLKPRRNASREAVAAHQKVRLYAAMTKLCARRGFAAVTVNELAAAAGVSKKTVYERFGSKEECFASTYDVVVGRAIARISAAYRDGYRQGEQNAVVGLRRGFDALATELIERPASSRLALLDALADSPPATRKRVERAEARFTAMIARSFRQGPDGIAIPAQAIRPLIGGVWFVARSRLLDGDPAAISDGGAALGDWLLSYRSTVWSRVPVGPPANRDARLADLTSFSGRDERARIVQAAAAVVDDGDFPVLSGGRTGERASRAAISGQFECVPGGLLDLLAWLRARILPAAVGECEGAAGWARGVYRALDAFFVGIAAEPGLARAAFLDAFAGGPREIECEVAIMRGFAESLARRAPAGLGVSPTAVEAIVGSVWSLARLHAMQGRERLLPASSGRAAFIALAPIVGAEAAVAAILTEHEPGRQHDRATLEKF